MASGLSVVLAGRVVVEEVAPQVPAGALAAIVESNGCGKTTPLRAIYRAQVPTAGAVRLGCHDVWSGPARDAALLIAMGAPVEGEEFEFSVHETVSPGRSPTTASCDDGPRTTRSSTRPS